MCTRVHTKSVNYNSVYTECHLQKDLKDLKKILLLCIERLSISIFPYNFLHPIAFAALR